MTALAAEFGRGHDRFAFDISPGTGHTVTDAEQAPVAPIFNFFYLHMRTYANGLSAFI
jgi:hypothetical protein